MERQDPLSQSRPQQLQMVSSAGQIVGPMTARAWSSFNGRKKCKREVGVEVDGEEI
jgi:hypothetical protein